MTVYTVELVSDKQTIMEIENADLQAALDIFNGIFHAAEEINLRASDGASSMVLESKIKGVEDE